MAESFAASEDLGFVALSLPTGGSIWLAAASIYAVEVEVGENFSMVKTVGEAIGVTEAPEVIFQSIQGVERNSEKRAEERAVQKFVEFVRENNIDVQVVPDEPIVLAESDERAKALGLTVSSTPDSSLKTEDLTDDQFEKSLRSIGFPEEAVSQVMRQRRDAELEDEFGDDLSGALERVRQREEQARGEE